MKDGHAPLGRSTLFFEHPIAVEDAYALVQPINDKVIEAIGQYPSGDGVITIGVILDPGSTPAAAAKNFRIAATRNIENATSHRESGDATGGYD